MQHWCVFGRITKAKYSKRKQKTEEKIIETAYRLMIFVGSIYVYDGRQCVCVP